MSQANPTAAPSSAPAAGVPAVSARCSVLVANGMHNAFPALCHWQGAYWLAFRQGQEHQRGPADIVLLRSTDSYVWESVLRVDHRHDDRDPQLIPAGDRLILQFASRDEGRSFQSYAAEIEPAGKLGPIVPVYQENFILWRPIFAAGRFFCAAYTAGAATDRVLHLVTSDDGLSWRQLAIMSPAPGHWSETCIRIAPDGTMFAFLRRKEGGRDPNLGHAQIWQAAPPYQDWRQVGGLPFRIEGPGVTDIAGKTYLFTRGFNALGSANAVNIYTLEGLIPTLHCSIPCMRDSAYCVGVPWQDQMLAAFYCTAPDGVNLYLARLPL